MHLIKLIFIKMKKIFLALLFLPISFFSQQVEFTEFKLDNGLHVILHQDNTAPVVITSVMYNVGGKDREKGLTGFAHFFEHLLFEGSENIERGEFMKIIPANGGTFNAYTSNDETYYYEIFPSNKLELGLWMESERMLHPVIDEVGVETQNEVVKEEKRQSYDRPYGKIFKVLGENLFSVHPYKDENIGRMEDLDAATLDDFYSYFEKYYGPGNAVLVVAGDINIEETKGLVTKYFSAVKPKPELVRSFPQEDPITELSRVKTYDANIQVPAILAAYRTPGYTERDAYVLDMISAYLSGGKSSVLYKKLVDRQKQALEVAAINISQKDYSMFTFLALPLGDVSLDLLLEEMDEEIALVQSDLISERDYQKLQNQFESQFVNSNASVEGIANSLAKYYLLYKDVNLINTSIDIYRSISREEIREVAQKYLSKNQRVEIEYLPGEE